MVTGQHASRAAADRGRREAELRPVLRRALVAVHGSLRHLQDGGRVPVPPRSVSSSPAKVASAFSVDVEDYFHVEAFSRDVSRDDWPNYPSRVVANTRKLLDLLDRYRVRGTFFVLGWVAERQGELVREIRDRGHELGCHSYWHRLIYRLTPDEFRED